MPVLPLVLAPLIALHLTEANPKSRPYVAFRSSPFDQEIVSRKILEDGIEKRGGGGRWDSAALIVWETSYLLLDVNSNSRRLFTYHVCNKAC
jgi:hypothetical protein